MKREIVEFVKERDIVTFEDLENKFKSHFKQENGKTIIDHANDIVLWNGVSPKFLDTLADLINNKKSDIQLIMIGNWKGIYEKLPELKKWQPSVIVSKEYLEKVGEDKLIKPEKILVMLGKYFKATNMKELNENLKNRAFFKIRHNVEGNPYYKQMVSVALVEYDGKFLTFKKNESEERLNDLYSTLVGGHVSLSDVHREKMIKDNDILHSIPIAIVLNALKREAKEEINLKSNNILNKEFVKIINEGNGVSTEHVGIVYHIKIKNPNELIPGEIEKYKFLSPKEILKKDLEDWSRIAIESVL